MNQEMINTKAKIFSETQLKKWREEGKAKIENKEEEEKLLCRICECKIVLDKYMVLNY